jgi:hypothetical protein
MGFVTSHAAGTARAVGRDGEVLLEYDLSVAARVRAATYDASGRLVGTVEAGVQQPGRHSLGWSGGSGRIGAGTYFVLLSMGSEQARLKAVVH